MDTTLNVPGNANGLTLNRIFFIGTRNTASASELVINGVKPYVTSGYHWQAIQPMENLWECMLSRLSIMIMWFSR